MSAEHTIHVWNKEKDKKKTCHKNVNANKCIAPYWLNLSNQSQTLITTEKMNLKCFFRDALRRLLSLLQYIPLSSPPMSLIALTLEKLSRGPFSLWFYITVLGNVLELFPFPCFLPSFYRAMFSLFKHSVRFDYISAYLTINWANTKGNEDFVSWACSQLERRWMK